MNLTKTKNKSNIHFRSPSTNGQNWQSVADRINELERQNQSNNISNKTTVNNQKYTYLDPAKTTRVPNMTLKAFQKNAVQSYFERQQQQQASPVKETIVSPNSTKLRTSQTINGTTNGNMNYENHVKNGNITNANSNGVSVIRPQSLPVNKDSMSLETIPQTRLSLPNKLSQIINLTTQLAAQKQALNGNGVVDRPIEISPRNSPVKSPTSKQTRPTVIGVEKNNLQSINESGVPAPPPRRSTNRTVMPVRR